MRTLRKQAPKGMGLSSPDPICATAPFGAHRRQGLRQILNAKSFLPFEDAWRSTARKRAA